MLHTRVSESLLHQGGRFCNDVTPVSAVAKGVIVASSTDGWPELPGATALMVGASSADRRVLESWAAERDDVAELIDPAELHRRLEAGGEADPLLMPVRVAWLPAVDRARASRLTELWLMATPKRPGTWLTRQLAAGSRRKVITGAPARLSNLRKRHARVVGPDEADDPDLLTGFVRRAGIVALERAERGVIGDRYKVPQAVAEEILAGRHFRDELVRIAGELKITPAKARKRAEQCLDELVAIQTRAGVDMFYALMEPLHSRTWEVVADESGLAELRRLNERGALVFLPAHRSYVDTLVLGDVLARNDFPRNHVMGGANLRIRPFSDLARRAGIVFIRRSFSGDAIYKSVVAEYFTFLLRKRFNLEWYFEGGRSRTGKLRAPRYGLLRYVVDAVAGGRVEDAYLVPTSVTYDRLHEVASMAAEQTGAQKRAEGLAWLAEYARSQRRTSGGKAYVRFGDPISVRSRLPHPSGSTRSDAAEDDRTALHKLAFEVAVGINETTPVTANGLVSLVLLGVRDQYLTLDQVVDLLAPVLDHITARGIPGVDLERLRTRAGVQAVLTFLRSAKVVASYDDGPEPVYAVGRGQHLVAAFYRNNAIHWFLHRAIVEVGLLWASEHPGEDLVRAGWQEAQRLRDQLKFEFFFPDREIYYQQLQAELELLMPGIGEQAPDRDQVVNALRGARVLMAHRVLRSFLDAQLVVADRLTAWPEDAPVDRGALLAECDSIGQQMVLQRRLHGMESVSRELFGSALDLYDNQELLTPGPGVGERRREALTYVDDLIQRVRIIEQLDASNRAEVTGVDT